MQFHITDLKNAKTTELVEALNSAYADYFIKIEVNDRMMADKIALENIVLERSAGVYADDKLVGFILIGIDDHDGQKTAYNGGTGVLPQFRGNGLTRKMYDFILPGLKTAGADRQLLEVISENEKAIKIYEKIGFQRTRTLCCFKGGIKFSRTNQDFEVKVLDEIDERLFAQFWNAPPSWQNTLSAVKRSKNPHRIVGAFIKTDLAGYIIYNQNGRVKQFAVKKEFRHSCVAQTLFAFAKSELNDKEIIITNIEKNDRETISFLSRIGLSPFLEQFEMTMNG